MEFEWDELKRQANIQKHSIDFVDAQAIFDGRFFVVLESKRGYETRFLTTGEIDGVFYTVIWTWRDEVIRIMSARRARDAEKRNYRSIHN